MTNITPQEYAAIGRHYGKSRKILAAKQKTFTQTRIPLPLSEGEETLARDLVALKIPFKRGQRFTADRKWEFDFTIGDCMIAVEVEGGVHSKGRHTRGAGYEADCKKYNAAALAGWTVLRYSTSMVTSGIASTEIEQAYKARVL